MPPMIESEFGFIAIEEFQNVFVEFIREMEESGATRNQIGLCDTMRLDVLKRARGSLEEVVRRNPAVLKDPAKEKAAAAAEQESQRNRETWEARVARGRAQAFADQKG